MPIVTQKNVELAKVGEWNTSTGKWTCTREQIADAARAYAAKVRASIRMKPGHRDPRWQGKEYDGHPYVGEVTNLRASEDGDTLLGDLTYPSSIGESLRLLYPNRSIEADLGVTTKDGQKYAMVMTGLALLGMTPPAVSNLRELEQLAASGEAETPYEVGESIAATLGAVEAAAWTESLHPRQGGKFVSKGSGYSDPKKAGRDGKPGGKADQAGTVKKLQEQLVRLGLLSPSSGKSGGVDGLFGPKTQAAVMRWQQRAGLKPTGKVTPGLLSTLTAAKKSSDPKKLTQRRMAQRKAGTLPAAKKAPAKPAAKVANAKKTAKVAVARKQVPAKPKAKKPVKPAVKKAAPKKPALIGM